MAWSWSPLWLNKMDVQYWNNMYIHVQGGCLQQPDSDTQSAQHQPLDPSLCSCWHLHIKAPEAAAVLWLLVETRPLCTEQCRHRHTHTDLLSSGAQTPALSQQGCPRHPCLVHVYTHRQTISRSTLRAHSLSGGCLRPPVQPTDSLVSPGSSFGIWLQSSYPTHWLVLLHIHCPSHTNSSLLHSNPKHTSAHRIEYTSPRKSVRNGVWLNDSTDSADQAQGMARAAHWPGNCLQATGTFYTLISRLSLSLPHFLLISPFLNFVFSLKHPIISLAQSQNVLPLHPIMNPIPEGPSGWCSPGWPWRSWGKDSWLWLGHWGFLAALCLCGHLFVEEMSFTYPKSIIHIFLKT